MVHFSLTIMGSRYHGLYIFHWPILAVNSTIVHSTHFITMDHCLLAILGSRYHGLYSMVHYPLALATQRSIPTTIVHGPLSFDHTQGSTPWTIVHGPLSVSHTRWCTIVLGPLSVGHT